jgi:hypothetical protein
VKLRYRDNGRMTSNPRSESRWSLWSEGSILCIGSKGSLLSIGADGSVLSIGSVGSVLSIGANGSVLSIDSVGSVLSVGSIGSAASLRPPSVRSMLSLVSYPSKWAGLGAPDPAT